MLWKYCKNIVNVTLFFLNSSPDFDNHNFFFLPFSAITLPQLPKKKFHLFRQCYCHNWFVTNFFWTNNNWLRVIYCENVVKILWTRHFFFFYSSPNFETTFFPPFSAMPLPQLLNIFLFPHFNNGIATISLSNFFFFFSL